MEKKRILVVDDFPVVALGLKALLNDTEDLVVTATAHDTYQMRAILGERPCDVILLDSALPGVTLPDLLSSLRTLAPRVPVLLFCPMDEEYTTLMAFQGGVKGHVLKSARPDEILKAVRVVAWGGTYISGSAAEHLAEYVSGAPRLPEGSLNQFLSQREYEVLRRLVQGATVGQIAQESGLSAKTISTYKERLRDKLGIHTLAGLVRYALENNIVKNE